MKHRAKRAKVSDESRPYDLRADIARFVEKACGLGNAAAMLATKRDLLEAALRGKTFPKTIQTKLRQRMAGIRRMLRQRDQAECSLRLSEVHAEVRARRSDAARV